MENVILLHGAIGAKEQLNSLKDSMQDDVKAFSFNFSGHGDVPFSQDGFAIDVFAKEVVDFMTTLKIERASIFGYSMGGYVGMYLALHYPEKINKLITLGTKYNWDQAIAEKEILLLDPGKIQEKLPAFATLLQKRHATNDWKIVLHKTAEMMREMGKDNPLKSEEYSLISQPVLLLLGDRDKMVTLEETVNVFHLLPNASLSVLPDTPHPIEMVSNDRLVFEIRSFVNPGSVSPPT